MAKIKAVTRVHVSPFDRFVRVAEEERSFALDVDRCRANRQDENTADNNALEELRRSKDSLIGSMTSFINPKGLEPVHTYVTEGAKGQGPWVCLGQGTGAVIHVTKEAGLELIEVLERLLK